MNTPANTTHADPFADEVHPANLDGHASLAAAARSAVVPTEPQAAPAAVPAKPKVKLTLASLFALVQDQAVKIEGLEAQVQTLKTAAPPARTATAAAAPDLGVATLGQPYGKGACSSHGVQSLTKAGCCSKCLNEARRQAAMARGVQQTSGATA